MSATPPPLPYDEWEPTKATLHLVTQIVGKVKLGAHPKQPHWWHATLHVTPRGISTLAIPTPDGHFDVAIDVLDLSLVARNSEGLVRTFALADRSVAEVYAGVQRLLSEIGHPVPIIAKPYDNPHSSIPFDEDEEHRRWDHDAIVRWWRALLFTDEVFKSFAGRSFARTSPVHLFWHSFDMAVTRFTQRRAPTYGEGARRSDVEAYSHEVISFGFWPGDPEVRFPAYYSYTAPEPDGLDEESLEPTGAWWQELPTSHMALLKYDDVRSADDPRHHLLAFLQSAFEAGRRRIPWEAADDLDATSLWKQLDQRFSG